MFVFALESLFQSEFVSGVSLADQAVLILLSMAVALSLYTATFSVLECALPVTLAPETRTHLTPADLCEQSTTSSSSRQAKSLQRSA